MPCFSNQENSHTVISETWHYHELLFVFPQQPLFASGRPVVAVLNEGGETQLLGFAA